MTENFSDKISDTVKVPQTHEFYEFGAFRLDVKKQRLWRGEELVALTPKEFELLLILILNAGRVVEKDDLHEKIWTNTFVEDGTLTRNISWLRKKLGAGNSGGEKFIETLPKRGYRFLPEVTKSSAENALVVEEQTLTRIRVEETISVPEIGDAFKDAGENRQALANIAAPRRRRVAAASLLIAFGALAIAAIGFAVYQIYFRQSAPKTIFTNRIKPFSGLAGREDMPAFSPDGEQMTFAWNGGGNGGNLDVYVKIVGAGEPSRLTSDARDEVYPRFSPDNRFIAFIRDFKKDGGEVILIPALGGAERRICRLFSASYSISFSPDGLLLAVIDADSDGGGEYAVHTVNLQTGEKRRITAPAEFTGETTPRFSPDGTSIAFVRIARDMSQDLFVVPAAGGAARQVTFDRSTIHSLAWNADGQSIIFTSLRGGDAAKLWRIAAGGGAPELIAAGGSKMTNLTVSPDGKTIAFVETELTKASIWRLVLEDEGGRMKDEKESFRRDSISPSSFIPRPFIVSALANYSPHFSLDGKRIVFASDRTGVLEIWLTEADGKNLRQLTFAGNAAGSPRFSPDGRLVAYAADNEYVADNERGSDIFIVSTEVGAPRRLTDAKGKNFSPAWSADGAWIYFCSNRTGDFQIWKMPSAGGDAIQITGQGGVEAAAAPDGKTIFYSKRNAAGLWRVSTDGGGESPAAELAEAGLGGSWTITNAGIYFVAHAAEPPYKIKFYDFSTAQTKQVAGVDKLPPRSFAGFSASADGKTFLYALFDQNASSIMLAEITE